MAKSLSHYVFPAVGGLFVTYLYNVLDGIFVGQGIGASALGEWIWKKGCRRNKLFFPMWGVD